MFRLTFPGGYGILHANRGRKPKRRGDDGHEANHLKAAKDLPDLSTVMHRVMNKGREVMNREVMNRLMNREGDL